MKLRFCVICGTNKNLQHHHIIPKSIGGSDHQHNIITLCWEHHNWIHNIRKTQTKENFVKLCKAGQKKGVGGRPGLEKNMQNKIVELRKTGNSIRQIAKILKISSSVTHKICKQNNI